MKYLLIGGAGYVGARLARLLKLDPQNHVDVLDLGLLWPAHVPAPCEWRDVLAITTDEIDQAALEYDCVVWLATIHDTPEEERDQWLDVTYRLMVRTPLCWARRCRRFVYFSSMRAVTHPDTLYGQRKALFEALAPTRSLIIRPGTVWGGYNPDLPNRNHTAINRTLLEPTVKLQIPENHVHMDRLLDLTIQCIKDGTTGVVEALDPKPWRRPELGEHPMEALRRHYKVCP